ncbi:MAG: hypothetical protein A2X25_02330 [Chloroflexi bacterium GWB2_49_20]|nr:MAG: hypothetical protein A2X25_02330 [Chloroflexi bacterium GWB2_49_20]OGN79692.1 MAG: hypothetical protein A2X26_07310 [Chloroflexi bacterium GWC2_49_37]OGN85940.1 MAG: hypothetical protein A2X27_00070 [Chloroflexi bacterium GWD2_49_16]HBG74001.1 Fe3+/spermidine/putrescine ABC transporter ATP-binding protein [Anaerolineae bacterium]HCC78733.1 Fe3+/spermidine/putrescine ABC transporter ATP-binding protein [Anaerolineae bacterium]
MKDLILHNLSKRYQKNLVVEDLSLEVKEGEFVSMLGPSGCGKTTTLRMIAGLVSPDEGQIILGGRDITFLPPEKRGIGMVFQDYALFPHMTIEDNVGFGLQMHKVPRSDIKGRIDRALDLVQLTGLQKRYPHQLSGGQQQRGALARALVIEPQLLLLDEPLSNLDAKLRQEMRVELKDIQQRIGITTIFVTHDQIEALSLSDRILVMVRGCIVQEGTPIEIYEKPKDSFVASFLGQENFIDGKVVSNIDGLINVKSAEGLVLFAPANSDMKNGDDVILAIKKERIKILPEGSYKDIENNRTKQNAIKAKVEFVTYLGTTIQYLCSLHERRIVVSVPNEACGPAFKKGDAVTLLWEPLDCISLTVTKPSS